MNDPEWYAAVAKLITAFNTRYDASPSFRAACGPSLCALMGTPTPPHPVDRKTLRIEP